MPTNIQPSKEYYFKEILETGLIPLISSYTALYNLVTKQVPDSSNKLGTKRELIVETTKTGIKAIHDGKPWNKIKGKIKIEGKEIIKFLRINNLI